MACGRATTGPLFTPRDRLEYNFYLFLFLIGTTPIATDFWSDLDKQGDTVAEDKVLVSIQFNPPLTLIPPVLLTYLQLHPSFPTF